jgi:hypothetical protein
MIGPEVLLTAEPSFQPHLHFLPSFLPSLLACFLPSFFIPLISLFFVFSKYQGGDSRDGGIGSSEFQNYLNYLLLTGHQCEVLSPCTPSLCEHGGHCESDPDRLTVCSCPPGWQGTLISSSSSRLPSLFFLFLFLFPSFSSSALCSMLGNAREPREDSVLPCL